jgi:hypothetical protein
MSDKTNKPQRDIRDWITSPGGSSNGTPARRRRVMTTSDSENERNLSSQRPQQLPHPQNDMLIIESNQPDTEHQDAGEVAVMEVIRLSSSSEDSTNIPCSTQPVSGAAAQPARRINHGMSAAARRSGHSGRGRCIGKKRSQKSKRNFCAEAEETDSTDDSSVCDESEPDAQCLYRQAINGVRNASNARTNLRRATMNCPVCAQFAAFLQHFLSH